MLPKAETYHGDGKTFSLKRVPMISLFFCDRHIVIVELNKTLFIIYINNQFDCTITIAIAIKLLQAKLC